ncbi:hypothetical protein Agub_g8479, partial [Astrephomene gubernaculifera]
RATLLCVRKLIKALLWRIAGMPAIQNENGDSLSVWEYSPWRSFIRFGGQSDADDHPSHGSGRVLPQMFREDVAQSPADATGVRDIFGRALDAARSKRSFASAADLSRSMKHHTKNATRVMAEDNYRWGTAGRLYIGGGRLADDGAGSTSDEDSDADDDGSMDGDHDYSEAEESYAPLERSQGSTLHARGQYPSAAARIGAVDPDAQRDDTSPGPRNPDNQTSGPPGANPSPPKQPSVHSRFRTVATLAAAASHWRNARSCPNLELPFPIPGAQVTPGSAQLTPGAPQTPADSRRGLATPLGLARSDSHAPSRMQQVSNAAPPAAGGGTSYSGGVPAGTPPARLLARTNTMTSSEYGMASVPEELTPQRRMRSMASLHALAGAPPGGGAPAAAAAAVPAGGGATPVLMRSGSMASARLLHVQAAAGPPRRGAELPAPRTPLLQHSSSMSRGHGGAEGPGASGGGSVGGGGGSSSGSTAWAAQREFASQRSMSHASRRLNLPVADAEEGRTGPASEVGLMRSGTLSRSIRAEHPAALTPTAAHANTGSYSNNPTSASPGSRLGAANTPALWRTESRRAAQSQPQLHGSDVSSMPPACRIAPAGESPSGGGGGRGVMGRIKGMFQ